MFETGNLLFFKPFIFKNGAIPQNKFMVVLGQEANGNIVLASLPTSKDHVPSDIDIKSGCIDLPERQVNVFVFKAGECIIDQNGMKKMILHLMSIRSFMAAIWIHIRSIHSNNKFQQKKPMLPSSANYPMNFLHL